MSELQIIGMFLIAAWGWSIWYAYSIGRLHGVAAGLREARIMHFGDE